MLPQEIAVTFAEDRFAEEGEVMTDQKMKENLESLGAALVEMLKKIRGGD